MIDFTDFMLLKMCARSWCSNFFSFIAILSSCYILNLYLQVVNNLLSCFNSVVNAEIFLFSIYQFGNNYFICYVIVHT